ncbi:MAG: hypothetical protein CVV50_03660 [Spirochaetae bacterium HGW-Spirochaetae-6]|nr:MAG: hypothetical protein CVV50_03660 [Spirochaetae bacterium HGW-Spirochaetae-6]
MQKFALPIILAALSAVIVLLGGLLGGVSFVVILKRLFIFALLMGGIGFLLIYLLEKWGIDLTSPQTSPAPGDSNSVSQEENINELGGDVSHSPGEASSSNDESQSSDDSSAGEDSLFDYTVKDDEDVEFKPLDNTIIEQEGRKYLNIDGERIEYDPKTAAKAIRQLLNEDKENE